MSLTSDRTLAEAGDHHQPHDTMNTTTNEGYGYHGELAGSAWIRRQIDEAYSNAVDLLNSSGIATSKEEAIAFLDSRMGRHLGDHVYSCETINAISETIRSKAPALIAHFRKESATARANSK